MEAESAAAEAADIPIHVLESYECADGGVVNPVGVLDSSLDAEVVTGVNGDNLGQEAADDADDAVTRADPNLSQSTSPTLLNSATTGYLQTHYSRLSCFSTFLRGVRALWSTQQTENTSENRELQIKVTLRELLVYLIFLIDVCIMTFGMTNSMTYYFTDAVTEAFVNKRADVYNPDSSFKEIDGIDEWYTYVSGPLLHGLYGNTSERAVLESSDGIYVLEENRLIGSPRLRTLRVRNDSCNVHLDFREFVKVCYDVYSADSEDKAPFGLAGGSAWVFHTAAEVGGSPQHGRLAVYHGGGYIQDLVGGSSSAPDIIDELRENGWLDRGTRATFIDFSLYNANVNIFCIVSLLCEFPATGGAVTSWNIRTLKLLRYVTALDYFVLACECLFILFILYYIVEEVLEIKHNGWLYFTSFFSVLDLVIIASSVCCISFGIRQAVNVEKSLHNIFDDRDKYISLAEVGYWQTVFDSTLAVTLFLAWIKLFKFISFNRTMMQLSATMSSCVKDLLGFTLMFVVVFLSFAQFGFLVFGSQVESYAEFSLAVFSQFRILLGDFKFSELQQSSYILGPAYFVLYVFFIFFILLNMFLAIVNDAYSEVKSEMSRQKHEFEMIDFFKKSCRNVLAKLRLRHEKTPAGQGSSSEAASGRTYDLNKWRTDRLREGYTEAQIMAVSARYDIDVSHGVSRAELRKMQADLSRQKFAEKEDSDSLDLSDEEDDSTTTKSEIRGGTGRRGCGGNNRGGRGVTHEEFSMLQRRVDRMEHSIGSIVSKIDAVLVKLEAMEQTKARRRETVGHLLDSIAESEGVTDESKRQHMERLVRDELERWDSESCISSRYDPSPPSSTSGRAAAPAASEPSQEFFGSGSNAC